MQGAAELFEEMITRTPTDRRHNSLLWRVRWTN